MIIVKHISLLLLIRSNIHLLIRILLRFINLTQINSSQQTIIQRLIGLSVSKMIHPQQVIHRIKHTIIIPEIITLNYILSMSKIIIILAP